MTLKGFRQSVIARTLGITAPSIAKAQHQMGLPTRLSWPEEKIMELFRAGWGGYRISKYLHVPANQVFAVAHKHNFRRVDGAGYRLSPELRAEIYEALADKKDWLAGLALRFGVTEQTMQRHAHRVWGKGRFRAGPSWPPLSSDFPQRYFPRGVTSFDELASAILSSLPSGSPAAEFPNELADAMVQVNPVLHSAPPMTRKMFELSLRAALRAQILAAARVEAQNRWVN